MPRIAVLGGSFDPPHLAHRQVVRHLLEREHFDEVWVFPSRQNPLKPASATFEDRLAMTRLALGEYGSRVRVREDESKLSGFTIDLVRHLKAENPSAELTFIAGSDLQSELPRWKDSEELRRLLKFEFLPRPPDPGSPFAAISSTEIRERVRQNLSIAHLVPPEVEDYIRIRGLYSSKTSVE
ncbi:MAG TPA: hypothetical protein DF383_05830 [Deltaproteobacteria bacterium]|nr:hypothetical protein [Deltaproteobacteria bacterium]